MIFQGDGETAVAGRAAEGPPPPPRPAPIGSQQQLGKVRMAKKVNPAKPLVILVIVIAAAAAVLLYTQVASRYFQGTTAPTTVPNANFAQISSCREINSAGKYYLAGSLSTQIQSGACLNVTASNVQIICNGNGLYGSGPYVIVPPFTYGILASNVSNVSVEGCAIRNFSYGVYARSSRLLSISSSNVSSNYVSNIWLQNSSDSVISSDVLSYNPSAFGSLRINGSSTNDTVSDSRLAYNAKVGIVVNATGNRFVNNTIRTTPVSFSCSGINGFKHSNYASANICFNSSGCSFAVCRGANIQPNLTDVQLGKQVSSCGTISSSGTYRLSKDISMNYSLNSSATEQPCINITAKRVTLDCLGNSISDASTGINIFNSSVSVFNCNVRNSRIGINVGSFADINISGVTLRNNSGFGISLSGTQHAILSDINAYGNQYGLGLSGALYTVVNKFNFLLNRFGIYLTGSTTNTFEGGVAKNNSVADVYALDSALNVSSGNLFQASSCTVGDAPWANCKFRIAPSLQFYPLQSCSPLVKPGTYLLMSNLVGVTSTCFNILQNGTTLNCNGHSIISPVQRGSGILAAGKSDVLIENCSIYGFRNGIYASGSKIYISNIVSSGAVTGINVTGAKYITLINNTVNTTYNYSIYLSNVSQSLVQGNKINNGLYSNIALYLLDSASNFIRNNSFVSTVTGMFLDGNSRNNTVVYNYAERNAQDYVCSEQASGINSESVGINYGTKKYGCTWMAAVLPPSLQPASACTTTQAPNNFQLTSDYAYGSGSTCFTITKPDSSINCKGHTVIATNGGTFAEFENASGAASLSNCNLAGFTNAVLARNSSITISNDTFFTNSSVSSRSTAINVTGSQRLVVVNDTILSSQYGIIASNVASGSISDNFVDGSYTFRLTNVSNTKINNNVATASKVAMSLINSLRNSIKDNTFIGGEQGLLCSGASTNLDAASDLGGNKCSNSYACSAWLGSSLPSCT